MIWNYNTRSASLIQVLINSNSLHDQFISLHIRAGDKYLEAEIYNVYDYMEHANSFATNKKAFILTDDYAIIEELSDSYSKWKFFTLCSPSESGYFHHEFSNSIKKLDIFNT